MRNFQRATIEEVLSTLSSDGEIGLTPSEVASRRKIHGPNKLEALEKVLVFLVSYNFDVFTFNYLARNI